MSTPVAQVLRMVMMQGALAVKEMAVEVEQQKAVMAAVLEAPVAPQMEVALQMVAAPTTREVLEMEAAIVRAQHQEAVGVSLLDQRDLQQEIIIHAS
jgi:hypothetical protein